MTALILAAVLATTYADNPNTDAKEPVAELPVLNPDAPLMVPVDRGTLVGILPEEGIQLFAVEGGYYLTDAGELRMRVLVAGLAAENESLNTSLDKFKTQPSTLGLLVIGAVAGLLIGGGAVGAYFLLSR